METVGRVVNLPGVDPDLSKYLENISQESVLNFATIREHIESGSGRFNEVEETLLLLESIIKRYKGEPGW